MKINKIVLLTLTTFFFIPFVSKTIISANSRKTESQIKEAEQIFSQNKYFGDVVLDVNDNPIVDNTKKDYEYIKGSMPILISAPHTIKSPKRNGSKDYKLSEIYTGALAKILANNKSVHVIYKKSYNGVDDNFPVDLKGNLMVNTPYRNKIGEIIKNNEIKLVIDLHGMANKDVGIDIGTNYGTNLLGKNYLLTIVRDAFLNNGFKDSSDTTASKIEKIGIDHHFAAAIKNRTISNYCATTFKTPSIQLEIDTEYRTLSNVDNFNRLLKTIEIIIDEVVNITTEFS